MGFQNLETTGNRLSASSTSSISGITRDLAVPLGDPGTVNYMSVLLRPEGILNQGLFNGFFGVTLQTGGTEAFIGKAGGGSLNEYVLENRGGADQVSTDVLTIVDQPTLLVLKAEHGTFSTFLELFVDPVPGLGEPESSQASRRIVNEPVVGLTAYSTGAYSLDEIRVGTTFADVVPIPEPSSDVILVTVLVLVTCCGRRPRRNWRI